MAAICILFHLGLLNVSWIQVWKLRPTYIRTHTLVAVSSPTTTTTKKKPKNLKQFFTPAQFFRLCVCAAAWKTSSLWPPLWLCFFSKELRWKAYSLWQRTSCSLCSLQHLWAHSTLPHWHRWHEACPYFLAPGIWRLRQRFPPLIRDAQVCIYTCMSVRCRVCVCETRAHWTFGVDHLMSHNSEISTDQSPPKGESRDKFCLLPLPESSGGAQITSKFTMVWAHTALSEVFVQHASVHVAMCVKERENRREWWGQWGVQCVRGLGATALWFLSLVAWRISSPVSQCWAHAGQGEPHQENLCWCQQWKHHHPSTTSHNICQTAVCPFFFLYSTCPPPSLWIFPFLLNNVFFCLFCFFLKYWIWLARGFTLQMACFFCGDSGNTTLSWTLRGPAHFGTMFYMLSIYDRENIYSTPGEGFFIVTLTYSKHKQHVTTNFLSIFFCWGGGGVNYQKRLIIKSVCYYFDEFSQLTSLIA